MITFGKLPRGLLALIGAQNFGEAPRELAELVSPVINISDSLSLNELQQATGTINPIALPFTALATVPAGHVWRIRALDALAVNAAGATATIAAGVRMNGVSVSLTPTIAVAASQTRRTTTGPTDLWLPSGAEVGLIASELAGAPIGAIQLLYADYAA